MTILLTGFANSPDRGAGQARDMRLRWALEEVGQPYRMELRSFAELKQPAYLARQPFGQIPAFEDGVVKLFESGAILLYLARRYPGLLPGDEAGRERAAAWVLAALNTVEPPIVELEQAWFTDRRQSWFEERNEMIRGRIRTRLGQLSDWLGQADWLEGAFSAGDLMMVTVLRRLETPLLREFPNLAAYVSRAEARPAFRKAFADQLALFETGRNPPEAH